VQRRCNSQEVQMWEPYPLPQQQNVVSEKVTDANIQTIDSVPPGTDDTEPEHPAAHNNLTFAQQESQKFD